MKYKHLLVIYEECFSLVWGREAKTTALAPWPLQFRLAWSRRTKPDFDALEPRFFLGAAGCVDRVNW